MMRSLLLLLLAYARAQDCTGVDYGTPQCKCYNWPCQNITELGSPTTLVTTNGPVIGRIDASDIKRFVGIPIAASTAGANRFKPPQPISWTTPVETLVESPCPSALALGTEDCVSVDVYTKDGVSGWPVAVWIHGGGFYAQDPPFALLPDIALYQQMEYTYLPNGGKAVLVLAHYRLGGLGFMAHPGFVDPSSTLAGFPGTNPGAGNYGMMDTLCAIKWTYDNAVSLGGDPSLITVFGESAGGAHVMMLMASPLVSGLVKTFISQSPFIPFTGATYSMRSRMQQDVLFTLRTGCAGGAFLSESTVAVIEADCLRSADASLLTQDISFNGAAYGGFASSDQAVSIFDAYYGANAAALFTYNSMHVFPVVDGFVLTQEPLVAYTNTNEDINVVIGHNTDEYTTFCYYPPQGGTPGSSFVCPPTPNLFEHAYLLGTHALNSSATFESIYSASFSAFASSSTVGSKMAHLSSGLYYDLVQREPLAEATTVQIGTDSMFAGGLYAATNALLSNPARAADTVFQYLFAEETDPHFPYMGACHGCELTYVLGFFKGSYTYLTNSLPPSSSYSGAFTAPKLALGDTMNAFWSAIFYYGTPNVAGWPLPEWSAVSPDDKNVMVFQSSFQYGAAMNPCVKFLQCRGAEPTKDFRIGPKSFFYSSLTTPAAVPGSCEEDEEVVGSYTTAAPADCPADACASWCNPWTTALSACRTCPVNTLVIHSAYCAGWCNVYTCSFSMCIGCETCDVYNANAYCADWCNPYTCWSSFCSGCATCAP